MGTVELDNRQLVIFSHIITYGNAADPVLTAMMRDEIETMWNEPCGNLNFGGQPVDVRFSISASFQPSLTDIDIYQNLDPRNNYFRIEKFAHGNISFVDGLGCNSGYFLLENLYKGSTTAAHEYGHTIGLEHPHDLDLRGKGIPGIMYPRGTLVDPPYQYEPDKPAGAKGGTLYPIYRKVLQEDISHLNLDQLAFDNGKAVLGEFTSVWHPDHADINPEDFT
ncbi:MAG: peptidase M10 [Bacteroidota bacterium]|nr:peptidase M10 [Bacteroidota bacterium]